MRPDKHEKKYRQFLKAIERLEKIKEELRNLPLRPLKTPFQRGWVVTVKLRDDISRRKEAPEIKQALELGRHHEWVTRALKDVKAIRRGEKEIEWFDWRGRKVMRSLIPDPRHMTEKVYLTLPEPIKKWFSLVEVYNHNNTFAFKKAVLVLPDYWLTLRAKPNMITHQYLKGGPLEKEEQELKTFLKEYWREWCDGGSNRWKDDSEHWKADRPKVRNATRRFLKGEADDISI